MKVPAYTNAYGDYTFNQYHKIYTWEWSRSVQDWRNYQVRDELYRHQYTRRSGYSKNPIALIPWSTVKWRAPSSYERSITQIDYLGPQAWMKYTYNNWDGIREVWEQRNVGNFSNQALFLTNKWHLTHVLADENQMARVRTECLLKIGDQKVQVGVALAEAKKTTKMVAGLATQLARALLAAKRGQWRKIPQEFGISKRSFFTGKTSTGRLLEMKYGWMPLMRDLYAASELLNKQTRDALLLLEKRTLVEELDIKNKDILALYRANFNNYEVSGSLKRTHQCMLCGRIAERYLNQLNSVGLVNPLSLAWEIVPYSFVIDWMLPVGNTLEALTSTLGLNFVGGYTSVVGELELTIQEIPEKVGAVGKPRIARARGFSVRREKLTSWPRPQFYVKSPFSTSNVVTAVALLRQLYR